MDSSKGIRPKHTRQVGIVKLTDEQAQRVQTHMDALLDAASEAWWHVGMTLGEADETEEGDTHVLALSARLDKLALLAREAWCDARELTRGADDEVREGRAYV